MKIKKNTALKSLLPLATLAVFLSFNLPSFSFESDNIGIKNQAYEQIVKIMQDKNVYTPYKIELLKRLAYLNGINVNLDKIEQHDFGDIYNNKNSFLNSFNDVEKTISEINGKDSEFFSYLLINLSDYNDEDLKNFSKEIVESINSNDYLKIFNTFLNSPNREIRLSAVHGLAKIATYESLEILLNQYDKSDDIEKKEIIEVIAHIKNKKTINFCKDKLKTEQKPELLVNLIINLVNFNQKSYLSNYVNMLNNPNDNISKYAVLKLSEINTDIDFTNLKSILYSDNEMIKLGIASYFEGRINNKPYKQNLTEIINVLDNYAKSDSVLLKIASIRTLSTLNISGISKILEPYIKDNQLSDTVINIVLSSKNPSLLPLVSQISKMDNDIIKFYSAISLLGNDNKNSIVLLKGLSNESDNDNLRLISAYITEKLEDNSIFPFNNQKDEFIKYIKNFENTNNLIDIIYSTLNNHVLDSYSLKTRLAGRSAQILPQSVKLDEIRPYLYSGDDWTKLNASLNFLIRGKKEGLLTLREILYNTGDNKIISASIEILGNYGDKSDLNFLNEVVKTNEYVIARGNAALAILEINKRMLK